MTPEEQAVKEAYWHRGIIFERLRCLTLATYIRDQYSNTSDAWLAAEFIIEKIREAR